MISQRAKDLWLALHEIHANEQGWTIIQDALDAERSDALLEPLAETIAIEDSER